MKFLFDFFPLLAFYLVFYLAEDKETAIYPATYTLIVSSAIQMGLYYARYKKFEKTHLIVFVVLLVFGGLTIYLHDDIFIKWKPTIVNWIFASVLLLSKFFSDKTVFQWLIGLSEEKIELPDHVWKTINLSWAIFFIFLGFLNIYIAYSFSTEFWVNFKFWGMMSINFLFIMGIGVYIFQYIKPEPDTESANDPKN